MRIYTYKNCSTCRKATQWLSAKGIPYEELAIRETPPTVAELEEMLACQGGDLKRLFNTAGGDYRDLGLKDRLAELSVEAALALLAERGNLVKRPFLLGKGIGLVGFKESEWAENIAAD